MIAEVNYLAVLLCGVASMVLGFMWYGPLFGKVWLASIGRSDFNPKESGDMMRGMWKTYLTSFISALILAYILASVLSLVPNADVMKAATIGFFVWLGFSAYTTLGYFLWERTLTIGNKGQFVPHFLISAGYNLVLFVVMGVIITLL